MYVVVVNQSPDPDENYLIGPFDEMDEAYAYIDEVLPEEDRDYSEVWTMNAPEVLPEPEPEIAKNDGAHIWSE